MRKNPTPCHSRPVSLPKPYYDRDGITIYHGDMLEIAPLIQADLLVTDPPYSRAGGAQTGRTSLKGRTTEVQESDQFWLHWFNAAARTILQCMKPSGAGCVFTDYRTINLVERAVGGAGLGWSVTQGLVWDRQSMGLGSPFRASHELIAFARGPAFSFNGDKSMLNVLPFRWPYGEHEHHPAEKPVALLAYLIRKLTEPHALVFDPFMGSGSTLVACKQSGRYAVGIEAEERYCEVAANRLQQEILAFESAATALRSDLERIETFLPNPAVPIF